MIFLDFWPKEIQPNNPLYCLRRVIVFLCIKMTTHAEFGKVNFKFCQNLTPKSFFLFWSDFASLANVKNLQKFWSTNILSKFNSFKCHFLLNLPNLHLFEYQILPNLHLRKCHFSFLKLAKLALAKLERELSMVNKNNNLF